MTTGKSRLFRMRRRDPARLLQLIDADDVQHRVDLRQVRERIREVAEMPPAPGVEVLRVQAEWARVSQHALAESSRALVLADLGERRDQPEGAGDERLATGGHVPRLIG